MLEPETVLVQLISNACTSITLIVHWFIIIMEDEGDEFIVSLFQTFIHPVIFNEQFYAKCNLDLFLYFCYFVIGGSTIMLMLGAKNMRLSLFSAFLSLVIIKGGSFNVTMIDVMI